MSDTDLSPSWHRLAQRLVGGDGTGVFPGRHSSRAEIAAETPIFHALTVSQTIGAARRASASVTRIPSPRPDPISEFHRDPLAAPIPEQAYVAPAPVVPQPRARLLPPADPAVPAPTLVHRSSGAHAMPERPRTGRHHRPVPVSHLMQSRLAHS